MPRSWIIGSAPRSSTLAASSRVAVCAVASASECERVAREKSSKRSRSTTVRAVRWPSRRRRPSRSSVPARIASSSCIAAGAAAERLLRADGAAAPGGVDRARVEPARQRVEVPARGPADDRDEARLAERRGIGHRADAERVQLGRGDLADAPEPLDGQRLQERALAVRRHEQQAIGLGDPARDLGEELRARDPHRDRQPDLVGHPRPQLRGDLHRRPDDLEQAADLEERLVDREALDERRGVAEDREHGLARRRVGVHPRRHHDGLGAERPRLPPVHRGAHAAPLRLVAAREHHAAADDHRAGRAGAARRAARPTRRTHRDRHAGWWLRRARTYVRIEVRQNRVPT